MERDDVIEYSIDAHHSEEEGVKKRKKIFFVTFILTLITAVEVGVGIVLPKNELGSDSGLWLLIKWGYIILTLFKAGYIVMSFMHLGEERKSFKWIVLAPYTLFIVYLIFICLTEGNYINNRAGLKGNEKSALEQIATPVGGTAATEAPAAEE